MPNLLAWFSSLLTTSAVTIWALLAMTPTQTTVDMKALVNDYHQSLIDKGLSLKAQTSRLDTFTSVMNKEIQRYEKENNVIIFVKAAVVSERPDITPEIRRAIIAHYKATEDRL